MKVLPGIHLVDNNYSNSYAIESRGKLILVDTGMDKSAKKIIESVRKLGYKPKDISHILLTHSHFDHIRGVAKIKELSGAKVAIHSSEAKRIAGTEPMILPKGKMSAVYKIMFPFMGYHAIKPDILLKDKDKIDKIVVIHAPGHTPGSVCFYMPSKKILFSGDLVIDNKGKLGYPNSTYNSNEKKMEASLIKISKLDIDYILPGHHGVIGPKASVLLKDFIFHLRVSSHSMKQK